MYKWNIDIILKNSGVILPCVYAGPEVCSSDVAVKLFTNKTANEVIGLSGNNENSNIFVLIGEVAAYDIYPRKEKTA